LKKPGRDRWLKQLEAELRKQTRDSLPRVKLWLNTGDNLEIYLAFLSEQAIREKESEGARFAAEWLKTLGLQRTALTRTMGVRAKYAVGGLEDPFDMWHRAGINLIEAAERSIREAFALTSPGKTGKTSSDRLRNRQILVARHMARQGYASIAQSQKMTKDAVRQVVRRGLRELAAGKKRPRL
jgi:hypothetical protein